MEAKIKRLMSHLAQRTTLIQQVVEETCKKNHLPINPTVLQLMGMQAQKGNADEVRVPNRPFFCELYHGTLDVCMENEVGKYNCMCKTLDSIDATVETQQQIFC